MAGTERWLKKESVPIKASSSKQSLHQRIGAFWRRASGAGKSVSCRSAKNSHEIFRCDVSLMLVLATGLWGGFLRFIKPPLVSPVSSAHPTVLVLRYVRVRLSLAALLRGELDQSVLPCMLAWGRLVRSCCVEPCNRLSQHVVNV